MSQRIGFGKAAALGVLAMGVIGSGTAQAAEPPAIVLVHGAFFTAGSWSFATASSPEGTVGELHRLGFANVVTPNLPGRPGSPANPAEVTIQTAAQKVCDEAPDGKSIFVGHSQGGAVITQALAQCPQKIAALLYVGAIVPRKGEEAFDRIDPRGLLQLADFTNEGLIQLKAGATDPGGPVEQAFFQDLRRAKGDEAANAALKNMVSEPTKISQTQITTEDAARDATPTFYLETRDDNVISPDTQRTVFETRVGSVLKFPASIAVVSHCAFLANPDELAKKVAEVATKISGANP
jgi:pimeloyl-ACP methyl ester carboxylesterase